MLTWIFAEFSIGQQLISFTKLNLSLRSLLTELPIFFSRLTTSAVSKTPPQHKKYVRR